MYHSILHEEMAELTERYIEKLNETISRYPEINYSLDEIQKEINEINQIFRYLSKKWSFEIIALLYMRVLKFNDLKDLLGGISSRTLTDRLRMLETAGILVRSIVNEAPIKIQYSLSERGKQIAISCYPFIYQSKI